MYVLAVAPTDIPSDKFNCISMHYRNLTCAVTPPDYNLQTHYAIEERVPYTNIIRKCPIKLNETACMWNLTTLPPYRQHEVELEFILRSSNLLGNHTQVFNIDHFAIIRPGPVHVRIASQTPSSVFFEWEVPEYFDEENMDDLSSSPSLVYEVYVEPVAKLAGYPLRIAVGQHRSFNVTNLIPFTQYVFSFRCKTTRAVSERMWSDYVNITHTTKDDGNDCCRMLMMCVVTQPCFFFSSPHTATVPYFSPQFVPNSYEVIKHSETKSSISLYWEPVDDALRNAPGRFTYVISYWSLRTGEGRQELNRIAADKVVAVDASETSHTFNDLHPGLSYVFKIYSNNSRGISKNSDSVRVDKIVNLPPKPNDVTAYYYDEKNAYEVRWLAVSDVNSYTVVWCKAVNNDCTTKLSYLIVEPKTHETQQAVVVSELDDETNYKFAVAATKRVRRDSVSSSLSWSSCVVPLTGTRIQQINGLRVVSTNSTAVKLAWTLPCTALRSVIDKYQISYCLADRCSDLTVNGTDDTSVVIDNLTPNSKYSFSLRAYPLKSSHPSEPSEPVEAVTRAGPPPPPTNLNIVSTSFRSILIEWYFNATLDDTSFQVLLNGRPADWFDAWNSCTKDNVAQNGLICTATVSSDVKSYQNYTVAIKSCVKDGDEYKALCSDKSNVATTTTPVSYPGKMQRPHSELTNFTTAVLSWMPPPEPNGPINYYKITIFIDGNMTEIHNVSGDRRSFVYESFDCEKSVDHRFEVQAVNLGTDGEWLEGEPSDPTAISVCLLKSPNVWIIIGIAVVSCASLAMLVFVIYITGRHFKKKIDEIKRTGIELPKGLTTQKLHIDIDKAVPRLRQQLSDESAFEVEYDESDFKNRHGSGTSHSSSASGGIASNTSGHGSGTSPSNASSSCVIPLTEMKHHHHPFVRTSSEQTSDQAESIISETPSVCQQATEVVPLVARNTNGYVTLASLGNCHSTSASTANSHSTVPYCLAPSLPTT